MRLKMRVEVSGLRDGQPWPPRGGTLEVPDDEAVLLIERQMAVPVHDPESGVETATADQTAVEAREALVPTTRRSPAKAKA
jgi:hypothetical protein